MSFFVANSQPPKFIEDLILDLSYRSVILAPNDFKIIDSFSDQLFRGVSFTVKQGDLAVKMCKKYKAQLHATFGPLVDTIIAGPHFQLPLRESVKQLSQIKLVKEEKKYISVTFPYNENLVGEIRKFKENNKSDWADWHGEKKEWQFSLTEGSVYWLCQALIPKQFEVDSQILEFYEKICEIHENIEKYAPMLVVENDQPMFKNVYHEVPQPDTPDLLKGILMAKRHGIEVWDNNYENFINSEKKTMV